jgi:hypothetical protein
MDKRSRTDDPSLSPANGPPLRDAEDRASQGPSLGSSSLGSSSLGSSSLGSSLPGASPAAPVRDPIPAFVHGVLGLFGGPLADVRFPDIDRASLEALAQGCCDAQLELEALEAALESARARTRAAQEALGDRAQRALAYARVFALGQPELEEALSSLRAPGKGATQEREAKAASSSGLLEGEAPRRRGRPRKVSGEPLLSIEEPNELSVGAAE